MAIVVLHQLGTLSALDASAMFASRDVGEAAAFEATPAGQRLAFNARPDGFHDDQTGSTWDVLGRATDGALGGQSLRPVVSGIHWFASVVSSLTHGYGRHDDRTAGAAITTARPQEDSHAVAGLQATAS